jgi:hypothetical protein
MRDETGDSQACAILPVFTLQEQQAQRQISFGCTQSPQEPNAQKDLDGFANK